MKMTGLELVGARLGAELIADVVRHGANTKATRDALERLKNLSDSERGRIKAGMRAVKILLGSVRFEVVVEEAP